MNIVSFLVCFAVVRGFLFVADALISKIAAVRRSNLKRKINEVNLKRGLRMIKNGCGSISLQEYRVKFLRKTGNPLDDDYEWYTLGVYDDTEEGRQTACSRYGYYMDELLKTRRAEAENSKTRKSFEDNLRLLNTVVDDITDEILKETK